ncbi:serine/threonine protein kinase, partial [Synechococcus sp. H55.10]
PVAAPAPPPTPIPSTPLPPQPVNRPLFPPINRAAPPAAAFPTPAQNPTPSFLQRLREERERLGKD